MADIDLGRLSLGAANLGNLFCAMSDDEAWRLLETAWDCGIRYFDTAPHYGLGLSERRLGEFLSTKPRDAFTVSTKAGRLLVPRPEGAGRMDDDMFLVAADLERVWDFSADGVRRSLEDSLGRLGLDAVDILYLHDPEEYDLRLALDRGLPALARMRAEGLLTAIGVGSKATATQLESVRSGLLDLVVVAGRLTLLDQSAAADVVPECEARGVGVVSAGVFNSGVLAFETPSAEATYEYAPASPEVLARVGAISGVCADYGVPLPVAALHYALRQPMVQTLLVGAASAEQVRENADRMTVDVPEELWRRLRDEGLVTA